MLDATILIVEDDAILALLLKETLSRFGYTVAGPLATGEEAILLVQQQSVDLILMDIELAGKINGIVTAETIHQNSDIPIVFLTGFSQDPLIEEAKIAAPYGYLIKPVPERELDAALRMTLHRASLDRQLKESRTALAKSEACYRHLFENSPLGIYRTTLDGKVLAVNSEMVKIFGYATSNEVIGEVTDLARQFYANPGRREEFVNLLRISGKVEEFEFEAKKRSGEIIWVVMNAKLSPLEMEESGSDFMVIDGFAIDITERKQAELLLRESEQKHRDLVQMLPDIVMRFDLDGKHLFVSDNVSEILELEIEQFIGKSHRELGFPIETCRFWEDALGTVAAKALALETEFQTEGRRGKVIFNVRIVPELDDQGKVTSFLSLSRDVTAYRHAEQNYQTLFREMLDGFALHEIICNDKGEPIDYRFLAVNPAFEKMTGLSSLEIIGRTVLEIMPDTEKHWIDTYGAVAISGAPVFFDNYSSVLEKHFEVTAYCPGSNQFACIFVDITERKQAEEEKFRLQAQLQQAQKMEAIGTLAGGIAHDFNNILGAILGYAEMAKDDSLPGSTTAHDLEQIILAAQRASELVKQVLAFSRQNKGKMTAVQPSIIIKETLKLLRSTLPTTIAILEDTDPDSGFTLADPTHIQQILLNLCTNAFHAMEEHGGTLAIALKTKIIGNKKEAARAGVVPGSYIQLSVSDSGSGIPEAIREKIFDPYFTTKETGKGTGMGLAIVHGIIKSYGGSILCESGVGEGTVFHVLFPVLNDTIQPTSITEPPVPVGTERILFVDDEKMLAEIGQTMLQRLGYSVTVHTNTFEALTIFKNQPDMFDVVITDQTMPGMTGTDLARRMLQIRPELPIILCTGYSNLVNEEKAKALGIRGFALKPLAKKDMAVLIRKVLEG